MGLALRVIACGSVVAVMGLGLPPTLASADDSQGPLSQSVEPGAAWMQQPEAAGLLKDVTDAQVEFDKAHRVHVRAERIVARLSVEIAAQKAATDAAALRIERYARSSYMGLAESDNFGALTNALQSEGMEGLAEAQQTLAIVGTLQTNVLNQDYAVLDGVQLLRKKQIDVRAQAEATMARAEAQGKEVLDKLGQMLGPSPKLGVEPTTPMTCPDEVPAGSLMGGAEEIGAKNLCESSVKQARTPAAAAAIVWAFNHLGEPYNAGGVPIDVENFGSFNCATFVAKAFYWGARNPDFLQLPWTPAYATTPAFLKPIGMEHKSGDINIMWRSGDIASSGGAAGHAQLFIADGWLIQSGGTGRSTNVTRYPNGWGGWQETHFAFNPNVPPNDASTSAQSEQVN